jgi:hypothetical protein
VRPGVGSSTAEQQPVESRTVAHQGHAPVGERRIESGRGLAGEVNVVLVEVKSAVAGQ